MAQDIIARGLALNAKNKTDKITVNNNINLDDMGRNISDIANYTTVPAVEDTYTIDFAGRPIKNVKMATADTVAKTVTVANVPTDAELFIELTYTNAAAIAWFANIVWLTGSAPTFTAGKMYRIAFFKVGTNWHGNSVGGW